MSPTTAGADDDDGDAVTVDVSAVRRSDSEDLADHPIEAGTVLLVAAGDEDAFWAGAGGSAPPRIGRADRMVAAEDLPPSARVVSLAPGGIAADVAPGPVLVCLADTLAGDELGPPFHVSGCARVDVERSTTTLTVAQGIDGVRAVAG